MEKCKEYWKPVENYEGLYEVSNYGRVKSLERVWVNGAGIQQHKEMIMKPQFDKNYYFVKLSKNNKSKYFHIHKLEMAAFIPNPKNYPCINHKDENKLNNLIWVNENGTVDLEKSNLEWCTWGYNQNYGTAQQRRSASNTNGIRSKPVLQYTLDNQFIKEWLSASEVERQLGFAQGNISSCCRGRYKYAYGYIWKLKEAVS